MAKLVDLHSYRTRAIVQRSFGPWHKRFGEEFDQNTKLSDLSNQTLFYLAMPGSESTTAFYELIMGALNLGRSPKFDYLDNKQQMKVVDIHLFLADQVRFEMMRRLGWLTHFFCQKYRLLELILNYDTAKAASKDRTPILSSAHPGFGSFQNLVERDKESYVRRLLPGALEAFKEMLPP